MELAKGLGGPLGSLCTRGTRYPRDILVSGTLPSAATTKCGGLEELPEKAFSCTFPMYGKNLSEGGLA
jgi:hypothetical protein